MLKIKGQGVNTVELPSIPIKGVYILVYMFNFFTINTKPGVSRKVA